VHSVNVWAISVSLPWWIRQFHDSASVMPWTGDRSHTRIYYAVNSMECPISMRSCTSNHDCRKSQFTQQTLALRFSI
jgi:hypothetical protein